MWHNTSLLHIYHSVRQWKNFENRLTFGEVMGNSLVYCFLDSHCRYMYANKIEAGRKRTSKNASPYLIRFVCLIAVLDPRVGHTIDELSPFISVLCHSDWLFHGESCPRLDVVHPRRAWSFSPACTWQLFIALSLSRGNSLVSSWCDHSMLASLLWRCLTVPSLLQLC